MITARATVDAQIADRLAKLLGMLGSDRDGEVINAARAANKLVRSSGLTWFDVIASPTRLSDGWHECGFADWRDAVSFCFDSSYRLSVRERDFIRSMQHWRGAPTEKQLGWLLAIYERLQRAS
jgi:hypothetical protein